MTATRSGPPTWPRPAPPDPGPYRALGAGAGLGADGSCGAVAGRKFLTSLLDRAITRPSTSVAPAAGKNGTGPNARTSSPESATETGNMLRLASMIMLITRP